MYPRTLALLLFVLPTLLDAQTLAESSSLQRLFDRLAHCNRVAAHRSALALSVTSVPEAIAAPVEEPFSDELEPPTPKRFLRLKRLPTEDDVTSPPKGVEHKRRWIWATYVIQDWSPTSGLPPLGQTANLLSSPSIISRPSATLVAPTFPPRRGIETYATPTVSLPAPTEFSPSSTVLIAAVIPVTDTSVLPLATGALPAAVYRGIFKEGARVAGMKQVPAVVVADLVASAMALVSSNPPPALVASTFPLGPIVAPSALPFTPLVVPRAHMQRVKRFKVEKAPVA